MAPNNYGYCGERGPQIKPGLDHRDIRANGRSGSAYSQDSQVNNYKLSEDEDYVIRRRCGPYIEASLDPARSGYSVHLLGGAVIFVPMLHLKCWVYEYEHLRDSVRAREAGVDYGVCPPTGDSKTCPSCKGHHGAAEYDHVGRCEKTIEKFWKKVHNLYWHRYIKNKLT